MTSTQWTLGSDNGELTLKTGVTGRAAKMGHRLTLVMTQWTVTVEWHDGEPVSASLVVPLDSLEAVRGEGGIKALSGPEKPLVRGNALKALGAKKFPEVRFEATTIDHTDTGYRLTGTLNLHGQSRDQVIDVAASQSDGTWTLSAEASVRQSNFGIKPFSQMMGALQVVDDVALSFAATYSPAG